MPTNEERRQVAARLRSLDDGMWGNYGEEYDDLRWACKCDSGEYVKDRLVDLIEPEPERTCERLARGDSRDLYTYWVCSECNGSMPSPSNYCPNCGCRVEVVE